MGFRYLPWRHSSRRFVRVFALSSAALVALSAGPSLAQTTPAPSPSTALVPYSTNYNGRTSQFTGQLIEIKATQVADSRGLTGFARESFIAASLTGGGIALAESSRANARVQNAAAGAAVGGATGALAWGAGCVGVALLTTAGFGTPLCALPALIGGLASGVAVGGAMGLFAGSDDDTKVTNPGNLTGDAPVSGSSVPQVTPGSNGNAQYFKFQYNVPAGSRAAALQLHGFNRTFICSGGFNAVPAIYRECMFVQVKVPPYATFDTAFDVAQWRFCGGNFPACASGTKKLYYEPQDTNWWYQGNDFPTPPSGHYTYLISASLNSGGEGQPVPTVSSQRYDPVVQTGYPLPALADNPAMAEKLNKPLSDAALANFMNEVLKHLPKGMGGLEYDPTSPVTAADVSNAMARTPQVRPTLGDMVRPINAPGQPVQLGSSTNNVTTNVTTPTPGTSTTPGSGSSSSTGTDANPTVTKEKAATDSEKSGMASAALAPLQNLLNSIPKPEMVLRPVACPILAIDMRGPNMTRIGMDFKVQTDFHCVLAEQLKAAVQAFMLFIAGLAAWRRFMSA